MPRAPGRTLVLFNYDWDADAFAALGPRWPTDSAGFDLFSFPSQLRLAGFDIERFVERLARRAGRRGWHAVVSHHEQFGALAAALLAQRMGWPGTPVRAVLACQHKLYARQVLAQVAPEANIDFTPLAARYGDPIPHGLHYPAFAKPIKAAFSVLARQVSSRAELSALTRFGPFEQWVIRRLVEPFDRVARKVLPEAGSAHAMLLEAPLSPARHSQHNLDGYVFNGELRTLGVVDAQMYPGTQAFQRFERPSRLGATAQHRARDVAQRFLRAIGFDNGFFNMEFFHDEASGQVKVIEFNPRLASQLADLYRRVDGIDAHAGSMALAHGIDPAPLMACEPSAGAAASFVLRSFCAHQVPLPPYAPARQQLARAFPDAWLLPMPKGRSGVERDLKWLGSHRYGVLHLGGSDAADLQQRFVHACVLLGWPAGAAGPVVSTSAAAGPLPQITGATT